MCFQLCLSTSASVRLSYSQYNIFVEDIMVRKVKFISSQSTYREVKLLLDSSSLKSIPLVDSRGKRLNADFNFNSCHKLNESRLCSSCQHLYTELHQILISACVVVSVISSPFSSRFYDPVGQRWQVGASGSLWLVVVTGEKTPDAGEDSLRHHYYLLF